MLRTPPIFTLFPYTTLFRSEPGRSLRCNRYRYPSENARRRTTNSGLVSLERTARIMRLRFLEFSVSPIALLQGNSQARTRLIRIDNFVIAVDEGSGGLASLRMGKTALRIKA